MLHRPHNINHNTPFNRFIIRLRRLYFHHRPYSKSSTITPYSSFDPIVRVPDFENSSADAASSSPAGSAGRCDIIPTTQTIHIPAVAPSPNFDQTNQDPSCRCEYHMGSSGHALDNCWRLREKVREGSRDPTPFIIEVPAREPYQDRKVPLTYEGNVENLEQQFSIMGVMRSGRVYENSDVASKGKAPAATFEATPEASPIPQKKVTEEEAKAFMEVIKPSEYKVVEQMGKFSTHISLLALLLSFEPHLEALLRVLTAAQVPKETAPDQIEETVNSIFSNSISFSDDKFHSEKWAHSRALHIVCKCTNFVIGRFMIDNDSALNVCSVSTLKQMNVDLNRICPSKTAV
ncbi:hypothetical protein CRG98_016463 [Punica granatum]|uniref:Uncharacterized protein n=1 Tax=Punica granatum TaxID=22663 RepID=A0A2I0K3K7_PUNGR|nr:hypothetical protein CRG98_016463 [Punica granatum]